MTTRERWRAAGMCLWCGKVKPAEGCWICDVCRPTVGRHLDPRRKKIRETYGFTYGQTRKLTNRHVEMVMACPTEEARKLLLGIREPFTDGMREAG